MTISFEDALKAKKLRDFFNEQGRIYIVVDATSDEVDVPEYLKGDPMLRLVLNSRMPQPIYIRDSFLESRFSFSGVPHQCIIPMNRIWAAYLPDEDISTGLIWDEDTPEMIRSLISEMRKEHHAEMDEEQKQEKEDNAKLGRKVGHLRVVK